VPALAGLLFLVFGGHAEAVSWIGGMADPLVTLFVLAALLLFAWALDSPRPLLLLAGSWATFAAALLSKESAAIFPGLAIALAFLARPDTPAPRRVRALALTLCVCALLLLGYFALRHSVLGFAFVNLDGLGTNSNWISMGRAFVLRSFIPHGAVLSAVFNRHLDVWLILPIVLALAWRVPKTDYRPLLLLALCFAAALAPILPLSIAVATPESERLIYMASAFASLLLVWFLGAALRRPALVATIVLLFAAGNLVALTRVNGNWQDASAITRSALSSIAEAMRADGRPGATVYVINAPDNVNGAYIFRRGFHEALRVVAPEQAGSIAAIHVLSVHSISHPSIPVRITQLGPRELRAELGGGWLIGSPQPSTPTLELRDWTAQSFVVQFKEPADGSLLLYFTPHAAAVVGRLPL
jgi:hypothetical protein